MINSFCFFVFFRIQGCSRTFLTHALMCGRLLPHQPTDCKRMFCDLTRRPVHGFLSVCVQRQEHLDVFNDSALL